MAKTKKKDKIEIKEEPDRKDDPENTKPISKSEPKSSSRYKEVTLEQITKEVKQEKNFVDTSKVKKEDLKYKPTDTGIFVFSVEHSKWIAKIPYSFLAKATDFKGFGLNDLEAEQMASALQPVLNKYVARWLVWIAGMEDLMFLMFVTWTITKPKLQMYNLHKKKVGGKSGQTKTKRK